MTNLPEASWNLVFFMRLRSSRCHHSIYCKLKNELWQKQKGILFLYWQISPAIQSLYTDTYFLPCVNFWEPDGC